MSFLKQLAQTTGLAAGLAAFSNAPASAQEAQPGTLPCAVDPNCASPEPVAPTRPQRYEPTNAQWQEWSNNQAEIQAELAEERREKAEEKAEAKERAEGAPTVPSHQRLEAQLGLDVRPDVDPDGTINDPAVQVEGAARAQLGPIQAEVEGGYSTGTEKAKVDDANVTVDVVGDNTVIDGGGQHRVAAGIAMEKKEGEFKPGDLPDLRVSSAFTLPTNKVPVILGLDATFDLDDSDQPHVIQPYLEAQIVNVGARDGQLIVTVGAGVDVYINPEETTIAGRGGIDAKINLGL